MANIFQRIFHTPTQCMIMDFIKDNKGAVEYRSEQELDKYGLKIGKMHNVKIETNEVLLSATLVKYGKTVFTPQPKNQISYTLICKKPYTTKDNRVFNGVVRGNRNDAFTCKVYKQMLDNYVIKNGCPCQH